MDGKHNEKPTTNTLYFDFDKNLFIIKFIAGSNVDIYKRLQASIKLPAPVFSFENVEGLVDMGAPLAIECEGAEKIYFTCNNSSPIEYLAPVPLIVSGTYTAWGVDAPGNEGEKATVEITVMETTQSYRRVALASSICAKAPQSRSSELIQLPPTAFQGRFRQKIFRDS